MLTSNCRSALVVLLAMGLVLTGGCETVSSAPPVSPNPPVSPDEPEVPEPPPVSDSGYYVQCNGATKELGAILKPFVSRMISQEIPYPPYTESTARAKEWRDCSGNFLRLASYVAGQCLEHRSSLVAPAGIEDYNPSRSNVVALKPQARTTRGIAKWYHDAADFSFQPIYYDGVPATPKKQAISADLRRYRHLIRPGAVLWFARTMPTRARGLPALFTFDRDSGRHINHMGTVTAVKRDSSGQVISFSMYHGRNPRKGAGITEHEWAYSGNSDYPPFGVGSQYLVAISSIMPVR